ncbi:MAG: hypothetical protein AB7P40_07085, partial [Chloroflexota bacterium]
MHRLLGLGVLLALFMLFVTLPTAPSRAEDSTFTLVGQVDGGVPSGQTLIVGNQLIIVSDDS